MGHPSRRVITKPIDNLVHKVDEYNNEGIISVYCAILGAIVLGTGKNTRSFAAPSSKAYLTWACLCFRSIDLRGHEAMEASERGQQNGSFGTARVFGRGAAERRTGPAVAARWQGGGGGGDRIALRVRNLTVRLASDARIGRFARLRFRLRGARKRRPQSRSQSR